MTAPAKGPLEERCDFCGAPRLHRCVEKRWRTSQDGLRYVETTGRDEPHAARVRAAHKQEYDLRGPFERAEKEKANGK